jgi:uncharacterized protein GlcG (DUF336 family)
MAQGKYRGTAGSDLEHPASCNHRPNLLDAEHGFNVIGCARELHPGSERAIRSKGGNSMRQISICLAVIGLVGALAAPAAAQLLTEKSLSAGMAMTIAQTALETCTKQGYHVSVHVLGRNGEVLVAVRGDGAPPHTMENSQRKAYTARTFRIPSGEFVQRVKDNPNLGAVHLTGIIAAQGALPIKAGDEVIGAVGVSGAPGGEKDEACAKTGIDKVADQLK